MALANPYAIGLDRNAANHVALSPLSFLERAAHVYPDRIAIVHGDLPDAGVEFQAGRGAAVIG